MGRRHSTNRRGFTMIELLIVLAIIAVLASLVTAGLFKALSSGQRLEERDDIRMLHEGVAAFMAHFGLKQPPPSYITLPPTDGDTLSYLGSMYPNPGFAKNLASINWGASGQLYGHEAIVFWLGGPQMQGWSVNPLDPTDPLSDRKIFANFRSEKLRYHSGSPNRSYFSPSNVPYAYFSPRWSNGGKSYGYQDGDCGSLPSGLSILPYGGRSSAGYANPDSYQIIGPGADSKFGTMGPFWSPQEPHPIGEAGADNLSNFHGAVLGARQ